MKSKELIDAETEQFDQEIESQEQTSEPESEEVKEGVEQFVDVIELKCDDYIDSKYVVNIQLPKVTVAMVSNRPQVQHSNLILTLNDNPSVCSKLIEAANKGQMSFKLTTFMDLEKTQICDVWELEGAKVVGIDFGQVTTLPQPEQRIVQCEIEFTKLLINGIKI